MTRISNQEVFTDDTSIQGDEYLIGTDPITGKKTRTYQISKLAEYIALTTDVADQDNIPRIVLTKEQSVANYSISSIINQGRFFWNPTTGEATGQINILDKWSQMYFKVPVYITLGLTVVLYYDIYALVDQGKGLIGDGAPNQLTDANFLRIDTTNTTTLPNTGNSQSPTVYTIGANDISSPAIVVSAQTTSYVTTADRDYYFVLNRNGGVSTTTQETKIYRFVGAPGSYGNGGDPLVDTDFILVDTSASEDNNKKPLLKKVVVPGVLESGGVETISALINSTGVVAISPIQHLQNELLILEVVRKVATSTGYAFKKIGYYYTGPIGLVNDGSAQESEFIIDYNYQISSFIGVLSSVTQNVISISTADISTPQDAVNNGSDLYNLDSTEDTVFILFDSDISNPEYKIYTFTGATGSYGNGGTSTAIAGNFTEIGVADDNTIIGDPSGGGGGGGGTGTDDQTAAEVVFTPSNGLVSNELQALGLELKLLIDGVSSGGGLSQEQIEDFLGTSFLIGGNNIDGTYNDTSNTYTFNLDAATIAAIAANTAKQTNVPETTPTVGNGTTITLNHEGELQDNMTPLTDTIYNIAPGSSHGQGGLRLINTATPINVNGASPLTGLGHPWESGEDMLLIIYHMLGGPQYWFHKKNLI